MRHRLTRPIALLGLGLSLMAVCGLARADEEVVPLAEGGDWVALSHHASMTAGVDVCIVLNARNDIGFRADRDGMVLRVNNETWALPTSVQGDILLSVGQWKTTLNITFNSATMVDAVISRDVVLPMFGAMDNASVMSVTVGKAKPLSVSLVGSTRATNAFRTCVGIGGNTKSLGANPFE